MEVEWLIVADAAEVVANKLYVLGGGWDRITINRQLPTPHKLAVAAAFRVPWHETNEKHEFQIEFSDADGTVIGKVGGELEVGRPPGIPQGQDQRTQIAVSATLTIQRLGTYQVVCQVDSDEGRAVPFTVVPGPNFTAAQKPGD